MKRKVKLKCKNCGHELIKRTALNHSGKTWIEHKGMIIAGIHCGHGFKCDCTSPEPEKEVQ